MAINFHFVPLAPDDLSGPAFISQTEKAFNELGNGIDEASNLASQALDASGSALATAAEALTTAYNASAEALAAGDAAAKAGIAAKAAQQEAEVAQGRADAAYDMAADAKSTAGTASGTAQTAQQQADAAYSLAEQSREISSKAQLSADRASDLADLAMGVYVTVEDSVDADEEFIGAGKFLVVNSESLHFPTAVPLYLTVLTDNRHATCTQIVWGVGNAPENPGTSAAEAEQPKHIYYRHARIVEVPDEENGEENGEEGGTKNVAEWSVWAQLATQADIAEGKANIGPATVDNLGLVKIGQGIAVEDDGTISFFSPPEINLATTGTAGIVIVGEGLSVTGGPPDNEEDVPGILSLAAHVSEDPEKYGRSNAQFFGHAKLTDDFEENTSAADGVGLSPIGAKAMWDRLVGIKGTTTITSSRTWIVPETASYKITVVGGGGNGGAGGAPGFASCYSHQLNNGTNVYRYSFPPGGGGGGGGSAQTVVQNLTLTGGTPIAITIGGGGGGVTRFGTLLTANGGGNGGQGGAGYASCEDVYIAGGGGSAGTSYGYAAGVGGTGPGGNGVATPGGGGGTSSLGTYGNGGAGGHGGYYRSSSGSGQQTNYQRFDPAGGGGGAQGIVIISLNLGD